jgi:hypothetical protein
MLKSSVKLSIGKGCIGTVLVCCILLLTNMSLMAQNKGILGSWRLTKNDRKVIDVPFYLSIQEIDKGKRLMIKDSVRLANGIIEYNNEIITVGIDENTREKSVIIKWINKPDEFTLERYEQLGKWQYIRLKLHYKRVGSFLMLNRQTREYGVDEQHNFKYKPVVE